MRRGTLAGLVLLLLALVAGDALGQGQNFCNQTFTATGAANTAVTLTAPAQANLFFYVCSIDIVLVANAAVTGAAGPAPIFTTTGLLNNLVWWGDNGALTIGQQRPVVTLVFGPQLLRTATPNTAFTIVTS